LDRELKELDYELAVQDHVEIASNREHWIGLELHFAALIGHLEAAKFLVEEEQFNPMQRDQSGINAVYVAALHGNLQVLKYFIIERNCNPACLKVCLA